MEAGPYASTCDRIILSRCMYRYIRRIKDSITSGGYNGSLGSPSKKNYDLSQTLHFFLFPIIFIPHARIFICISVMYSWCPITFATWAIFLKSATDSNAFTRLVLGFPCAGELLDRILPRDRRWVAAEFLSMDVDGPCLSVSLPVRELVRRKKFYG